MRRRFRMVQCPKLPSCVFLSVNVDLIPSTDNCRGTSFFQGRLLALLEGLKVPIKTQRQLHFLEQDGCCHEVQMDMTFPRTRPGCLAPAAEAHFEICRRFSRSVVKDECVVG